MVQSVNNKMCSKCKRIKPHTDFYKMSKSSDGLYSHCKLCKRAFRHFRRYDERYVDEEKSKRLMNRYKITLEMFNEMLKSQNSTCAICKLPEKTLNDKKTKVRDMNVDHCHKTGKVRGLLCARCNKGLGHFNDDTYVLEEAIKYLNNSRTI